MKKRDKIEFQKSSYYKRSELKSVIYLKSVNNQDNYILPQRLKLIRGSKSDNTWYRLHFPEQFGWSIGMCKLVQDANDKDIYNGIAHTPDRTLVVSIQILPKLKFCHIRAFTFSQPKELRLISVA